ncbi:MAG TPA: hypothetical protein DGM69_06555 [Chloroflexi bacterium]|nr:hypothetical protein [Chloroflexota bacterium]
MYASEQTDAMKLAISETNRRRNIQLEYNKEHNIEPTTIVKSIKDITDQITAEIIPNDMSEQNPIQTMKDDEILSIISSTEAKMHEAAKKMEFEKAAILRDKIYNLKVILGNKSNNLPDTDLL